MKQQSGMDIKVIITELKELEGGRIRKFYNTPDGELLIKLYKQKYGKVVIRVLRGICIHLTKFAREITTQPSHFTMLMRKYMKDSIIKKIEQPFFERVVIITLQKGENIYNIVIELFSRGNIIVCNEKMIIINALRFTKTEGRTFRPNEKYNLPEPRFQRAFLDPIEFKRIVKSSTMDKVVKTAAIDLGLGGKYAEELCALSGIDKNKSAGLLKDSEVKKLFKVFFLIYKSIKHYKNIKPNIIKKQEIVDFSPFPLKSYEGYELQFFDTYNEACDYYYSNIQKQEYEQIATQKFKAKIGTLSNRLEKQEETLKNIEDKSERYNKIGETIYANYNLVDTVLTKLRNANKNNVDWKEIKKMISYDQKRGSHEANAIKKINEQNNEIVLEINNVEFVADMNSEAKQLAAEYFEKGKKQKKKISGAKDSITDTIGKIEVVKTDGITPQEKIVEKKKEIKEWYEKYLWLTTSNNLLFVCGKDATQNEILIKKIATDNDLIFHSEMAGSPFGILKNGINAPIKDKQECATFVSTFSRAWRENIPANIFAVKRKQVSKTAPSGEYVGHGAFIIKGEKEIFNGVWPDLSIGYTRENKIIGGPKKLISQQCKSYVAIEPGNLAPGKIAKRIQSILSRTNNSIARLKSEPFLKFIPGDSRILQ